jgi:FkbM family methyltransferase
MFIFDATWWMPDGETQLPKAMTKINHRVDGRLTWQHHKYAAALGICPIRRRSIDVGAHVGLMSYWMVQDFENVDAFEPIAAHRDCWHLNVGATQAVLHHYALGADARMVSLTTPAGSSGGSYVQPGETIEQRTLDSFGFTDVDFLKIDCEGYEAFVIEGAVETIRRCRPVILMEQFTDGRGRQQDYGFTLTTGTERLVALGARVRTVLGCDVILEFA